MKRYFAHIIYRYLRLPFSFRIQGGSSIYQLDEKSHLKPVSDNNLILECFRPRGKIVCIGSYISTELALINDYLTTKEEYRLPILLITSNNTPKEICDQVVVFDTDIVLPQVNNLLNSYFLIFIFNSQEEDALRILEAIVNSLDFSGSIPFFVDTGNGLISNQRSLYGECFFNFDCSNTKGKKQFLVFFSSIISSLNPLAGLSISFSELIQIFGKSKSLFYGISSSPELENALSESFNQVGENLVSAMPEEIEGLETILLVITSSQPMSLHKMNSISLQVTRTFGKEFEIHFSNLIDPNILGYNILIILTDINSIEEIIPSFTSVNSFESLVTIKNNNFNNSNDKINDNKFGLGFSDHSEEDNQFSILGKIFPNSEVYIFNDGGLPLFASHRPAGQEVCLYTGLFSAIQSMSSDLIGHTPDHLTAGDKHCVFISQVGPKDSQLRGVAICTEGFEERARDDLEITMNIVKNLLQKGEPEYAINDLIQSLLINEFNHGTLNSIWKNSDFHAS